MVETVLNKILLNIDSVAYTEKPKEHANIIRGRLTSGLQEVTQAELIEAIEQGRTFTQAALNGTSGNDFISQQLVCADIDNDDKHHNPLPAPLYPEAAKAVLARYGLTASFMYRSFRYKPEHPKYRVCLILEKPITDSDTAKEINRKLTGIFNAAVPMCADTKVLDNARFFFGGRAGCVFWQSSERTKIEALRALPDPEEAQAPPKEAAPKKSVSDAFRDEDAQTQADIDHFDMVAYIQSTTGSTAKRRGRETYFNPCPMCGHNDCFHVTTSKGHLWKCESSNHTGIMGGTIIDYLMEADGLTTAQAFDKFKYQVMGYQRRERIPAREDRALSWNSVIRDDGGADPGEPAKDPGTAGQDPGAQAAPKEGERWGAIPVNGADLMDEDIPPLEWLVPDLLPAEGVSIISAPSKSYKSFLAMQICLALSRGGKFFGRQCEQRVCLYADLEGGKRREQDRLRKMGATKEDLKNLYLVPGESIGVIGQGLEEWIGLQKKYIPLLKLVIIDIFMLVRPALGRYSGDAYRIDTTDIKKLSKVAKDLDIAILLVHHNNKVQKEADVFNKMSGSTGMSGAVTCAWQITKERFSDDAIISIMGNDLESKQLVAYFDKQRWTWVCRGDKETVEQARIDKAFFEDTDIAAIKKIVDSVGTWKGTYKDFGSLAENLGFRVEDGAQAAKEFSQKTDTYQAHLAAEGYLVNKTLRNRSYLYTFQRADGTQEAVDLIDIGEQEELQV